MSVTILQGSCIERLKDIPSGTVQTCVTSPPYWGLRDYQTGEWVGGDPDCPHMRTTKIGKTTLTITGHKGMHEKDNVVGDAIYKTSCPKCGATRKDEQLGLEETPEEYVENLVKVFREVRRTLRDDGTLWVNLGDSYCGTGHKGDYTDPKYKDGRNGQKVALNNKIQGLKQKDLVGIPWRVAFALQSDGWYLRQDIIWNKPNPMPESVKDRCTKSHEYIFLLSKKKNYYFDSEAIKEEAVGERWGKNKPMNTENSKDQTNQFKGLSRERQMLFETRNKRSVWTVATKPYKEAHFATYPTALIEPCIRAATPKDGTVLDPFGGSGTTALVANQLGRKAIIVELNPDYVEIAKNRLQNGLGLFLNLQEAI